MAIYDLGTASLSATGEVTGVGTTWKAPLTLIRVGATIVFKTEPVQIYTISEIISDTRINVYNPNSETVPAGTGYAILAHDGITVQGLAQDVAETLRYYQSRETEVADAVDAFNNFDAAEFESKVTQVNTQHGDVVSIGAQVSNDAAQVALDKDSAQSSADSAISSAQEAMGYANSLSGALISSFEDGGTIESRNQQMIWIDEGRPKSYIWMGALPKVVNAGDTPYTSGGVSSSGWVSIGSKLNADYVRVADFAPMGVKIGVGNAQDDSAAITAALASGAKSVDFMGLNYTVNTWFIPQPNQTLISGGCSITQTVFGYPVFEQRYPNLTLSGEWKANFNGDRNQLLTTNTLGYTYVTEGDWKSYSSFLWQNYYQSRDVSGLICGDVYVRNFISGIWLTGPNASIGKCYFYNIDFGVFGVVRDNQKIETIYHSNITSTQLHEGHSLYMNGTGYGLYCGHIYVSGSPQYGSPVKIGGGARNFRIDGISGHGLSNIAYFRDSSYGSVGEIDCELTLNSNFTGPDQEPTNYAILVMGPSARVKFNGGISVLANQSGSVKTSFIQVTQGLAIFDCPISYVNSNNSDSQPSFLFTTSGGRAVFNGCCHISHENSSCSNYIFNYLGDSGTEVNVPPRIKLGEGAYPYILRYTSNGNGASPRWRFSYDTGLISPVPKGESITSTLNDYWGVYFSGSGSSATAEINGSQPIVTGCSTYNCGNTVNTNLGRLRYGSPGQELTLFNVGRFTALIHNGATGTDGNINISGGANIPAANWFCAKLIKKGSEFFVVSIYP